MGLSSFWSQLTGSRVKEITPHHRPFSFERQQDEVSNVQIARRFDAETNAAQDVALSRPATTAGDRQARRKSRGPILAKQKSEGNLKKRRSWFGGRPAHEEDVPALPALPPFGGHRFIADMPNEKAARPGTAVTANERISWSKSTTPEAYTPKLEKRKSFFHRKRSKSWFGGRPAEVDAPAVPPMPMRADIQQRAIDAAPLEREDGEEKRNSRLSLGRASSRSASIKRKRKSWLQSSNPDDTDDEPPTLPPVPPLAQHDHFYTPDSSVATTRSPDQADFVDPAVFADSPVRSYPAESPIHTISRCNSIKQPRPISGVSLSSRRSYVPKNAASGFLKSTTNSRRSSYRHSLLDDGDGGMMFLSEEQQLEWEKLKKLLEVVERRQNDEIIGKLREEDEDEYGNKRDRGLDSNAEALAALQFGDAS